MLMINFSSFTFSTNDIVDRFLNINSPVSKSNEIANYQLFFLFIID